MELILEGNNEALEVRIVGELVAESCGGLRQTVMETATREPKRITLNMEQVPFIDTSGLGVLVGLRAHLRSKGIALAIAKPSAKVKQVFKITRLLTVFGIEDND